MYDIKEIFLIVGTLLFIILILLRNQDIKNLFSKIKILKKKLIIIV